jgi:osmotically-inducible protein OsmY
MAGSKTDVLVSNGRVHVLWKERAMRVSCRKLILINCAFLGSTAFGSVGFAARADAQNMDAPALNQSASVTAQSTQSAGSIADEKLRKRVKDALHSDPYFYDEHVMVSIENGAVVLRGFVSSDWDLRDAMRIAGSAAGDRRVVDNLSIKLGGNR